MKVFSYIIILLISLTSLISNYKKFVLTINEINIFNSVASSVYEFDSDYINKISSLYPNLSSSAIPVKAVLGAYYISHDSLSKGVDLLKKGNLDNPFIGYPDMILARVFEVLGIKDSFNFYTNRAYNKLPNNSASYLLLSKKLINENKLDSLSYFFNKISNRISDNNIWQIYLAAMVSADNKFEEYNIDSDEVLKNAERAKIFSDDKTVNLLADYIIYGKDVVTNNIRAFEIAKDTFYANSDYAIKSMIDIIDQMGENYEFYETLIQMYFEVGDYKMVLITFDEMKNKSLTKLNGNILEMISISYIYLDDIKSGCELANLLNNNKYELDGSMKLVCKLSNWLLFFE